MSKKVIFFDVDGTLLDYSIGMPRPLQTTIDSIEKLKENGHLVVIATGRPKSFIPKEILKLNFHGYITSNGAVVETKGEKITSKNLDKETLEKSIALFRKEEIEFILEGYYKSYFSNLKSQESKDFYEKFGVPKENMTDKWNLDEIQVQKMVATILNDTQMKKCRELLQDQFVFMRHPGAFSYDIYSKSCSKADGIKDFLNHTGLKIENTYGFGDGYNDIEMIQAVAKGIAMGNANEDLKKHASHITDEVNNHGIVNGLNYMGLI